MASTYVNDLRLNEMATGDASGSWGTITNTNLELIGEAFGYGTESIGNADTTITMADGASDAARSFYLKITSSADLTTTRVITLAPNTVSKVWMIENATSGSQIITIKQGTGATINIPNGHVKMVATDGAGSGGAVLDLLTDLNVATNLFVKNAGTGDGSTANIYLQTAEADIAADDVIGKINFQAPNEGTGTDAILVSAAIQAISEGDFSSSSNATSLNFMTGASEAATTKMTLSSGGNLTVTGIVDVTDTTDASDATGDTGALRTEGGASIAKKLYVGTDLDVDGTTNLDIVDIDGAVDMASTLGVTGVLTANGGVVFNEGSADVDFRVESNGATNALLVDGGNNHVNIMTSTDLGAVLNVSGNAYIQHADNSDTLTLESTDADANAGPNLMLYRSSANPADGDRISSITYRGRNDNSQDVDYIVYDSFIIDASDGVESGELDIRTMVAGAETTRILLDPAETVFNEASADLDFRVESNGNANMLFVDGGNDAVGIGTASPNSYSGQTALTINSTGVARLDLDISDTLEGFLLSESGYVSLNAKSGGSIRFANASERMRIVASGDVGIGTTNPTTKLQVEGTFTVRSSSSSTFNDSNNAENVRMLDAGTTFNADGIDKDFKVLSADYDMISVDAGNNRIGHGVTAPSYFAHWYDATHGGELIAKFHHDGNNSNAFGIAIQVGTDDNSGTNYHIFFLDGDATTVGQITSSSGTVSYGAFTAFHPCIIPDADNNPSSDANAYPYGTLLETTSISYTQKNGSDTERGIIYNVRKSSSANSRALLGAYGSSMNTGPADKEGDPAQTNKHNALILGDGHILCNNSGGNIAVGDGITSSSTAGIGCKATVNPSMIIGIAQEAITFSSSETKLVAVQYGLQQFIPWA